MTSDGQIILFDIPSKPPGTAWSFNTWRTRMLLNYKGLAYRTEWLEYPQIRTRLEGHVTPHPSDPPYTLPAILLPDGTYIMHSRAILSALEERYPSPDPSKSVAYDTPHLARLWPPAGALMEALEPVFLPRLVRDVLTEGSIPFFRRTREAEAGMTLEELEESRGGERAYEAFEGPMEGITGLLGEEEGPFFGGEKLAHVDLVWVGILLFLKRLGEDVFGEVLGRSKEPERHLSLLEAVEKWTERGRTTDESGTW